MVAWRLERLESVPESFELASVSAVSLACADCIENEESPSYRVTGIFETGTTLAVSPLFSTAGVDPEEVPEPKLPIPANRLSIDRSRFSNASNELSLDHVSFQVPRVAIGDNLQYGFLLLPWSFFRTRLGLLTGNTRQLTVRARCRPIASYLTILD